MSLILLLRPLPRTRMAASVTLSSFARSLPAAFLSLGSFARTVTTETAFDVLAVARRLKAAGKDVIELQIGDSPFPTPKHAAAAGIRAIESGATHYCPSPGLPAFR